MALSNDLISQFVKVTKDEVNTKKESTTYGTIVTDGNNKYVQLDGSNLLTPYTTTTAVKEGDRVLVTVKDHSAIITGNTTDPSASGNSVIQIGDKIAEFDTVVADKVSTGELEAEIATINKLITDEFSATNAKIENIVVDTGKINELEAEIIVVNQKITAHEGEFTTVKGDIADFKELTAGNFEATNADIHNLQADYAEFEQTVTNKLEAQDAEIENLDVKYANIDFSNIDIVTMGKFFADSGVIENVVIKDGQVTGVLAGVTIKGDLIEGNTVVADKLVILGDDGLYYKLNTNGETVSTEQTEYNSLNGSIITAKSVTADKIAVTDLVAFGATIGGFHIGDHSLYSGAKGTVHNTINGIYMDDEGQIAIGDKDNFIKYYKDENGEYHLELAASTIKMESNKTIEEYITSELEKVEIGTRNYALDSENEVNMIGYGMEMFSEPYELVDSFKNCFGNDYYAISGDFKYVPQANAYGTEIVIDDATADSIYQIGLFGSSEIIGEPSIDNPAEINIVESVTITSNTTSLELDLSENPLRNGEALVIENNIATIYAYTKKAVLNGSENWVLDNSNDSYIAFKMSDLSMVPDRPSDVLCDKLPSVYHEDAIQLNAECNYSYENSEVVDGELVLTTYFGIVIRKDRLSTQDVDGFKTWLSNNNIKMYYHAYSEDPNSDPSINLGDTTITLLKNEVNTITSNVPINITYNQNVLTEENSVGSFWFQGWKHSDDPEEKLIDIKSSKWSYKDMTPDEYKRFGFVAKLPENVDLDTGYIGMACDNINGILYLKNILVEKGSITSDWTPAPEDLDMELDSTTTMVTSLEERYDTIVASVSETKKYQESTANALGEINKHMVTLEQSVEAAITSEDLTIAIKKEMDNGVTKVTTNTGFKFDDEGLTISKSGSEMKTNVDEDGLSVYKNNNEVLKADSEGVKASELYAEYFVISGESRFEKFERNGETRIGCFWID